jgi:hypothetical protein
MPCFPLSQAFGVPLATTSAGPDPLAWITAPPPKEARKERRIREALESERKRVSDEIDEQLRQERKGTIPYYKLVLLGEIFVMVLCLHILILSPPKDVEGSGEAMKSKRSGSSKGCI